MDTKFSNQFIEYSNSLYYSINTISKDKECTSKKPSLLDIKKYTKLDRINMVKQNYNHILYNMNISSGATLDVWLNLIREFAEFIIYSDINYMYHNEDSNKIYAEEDKKKKILIFYMKDTDKGIKAKITFERTNIPDNSNNRSILSPDNIMIITLDIGRLYGKQILTSFKFIDGESDILNPDNLIQIHSIANNINVLIIDSFRAILNHIIKVSCCANNIDLDEYINSGSLWIKKKEGL